MDEARYRLAMGHFATGVAIVTSNIDGEMSGMTVSAFASLSLEPTLVLICVETNVLTHEAITQSKVFAVNILREDQEEVSRRFAERADGKFFGIGLREGSLGPPLLDPCLATIECRLRDSIPGGDHTIFIGEAIAVEVFGGEPLLYYRSGYREMK